MSTSLIFKPLTSRMKTLTSHLNRNTTTLPIQPLQTSRKEEDTYGTRNDMTPGSSEPDRWRGTVTCKLPCLLSHLAISNQLHRVTPDAAPEGQSPNTPGCVMAPMAHSTSHNQAPGVCGARIVSTECPLNRHQNVFSIDRMCSLQDVAQGSPCVTLHAPASRESPRQEMQAPTPAHSACRRQQAAETEALLARQQGMS